MRNKKILLPAVAAAAVLALTGCHSSGSAKASESSARAFASSSAGVYDRTQAQKDVKKCFPSSETAQLKLAEPKKGKAARVKVEDCLAIPPKNRTAFDDALLNAVLHGNVKTKTGRDTLIEVTIPQLVVKYQ